MNVLAIDTAGPVIGVALLTQGQVHVRTERTKRGSEQRLVPWIEDLLAEAGLSRAQLDGIGVARGPGAFTGLRVGLATAAGLALALDRPVWGCDSLTPRAQRVPLDRVLAMLDARKQKVYAAMWADGVRGPIADVPPDELLASVGAPFVATGEGAIVYQQQVEAAGGRVAEDAANPAVDVLARLTARALAAGEGGDVAALTPLYVRAPDAKIPKHMTQRKR